jgi:hypothetical protein
MTDVTSSRAAQFAAAGLDLVSAITCSENPPVTSKSKVINDK